METTPPRIEPSITRAEAVPPAVVESAPPIEPAAPAEESGQPTPDPAAESEAPEQQDAGAYSGAALTGARWRQTIASQPQIDTQPRNPSLPTFAGLVTLILTFFIVLTSVSIKDREKSAAAMASLQDTFWGASLPVAQLGLDADAVRRDFMAGLTGRIQSQVPLMGGEKLTTADDQVLWLPLSLAFDGEGTEMMSTFTPVLQELLNAGAKIPERFDYKMELRLCADAPDDTLRLRAISLGQALDGMKAPLARYAIGAQACRPDRLAFAVALAPRATEAVGEELAP